MQGARFSPIRWIKNWLSNQVQRVPPEMSACEFECHKPDCRYGEWEHCKRRLAAMEAEVGSRAPSGS